MKLQYKHQQFQEDAAKCVVDVFAGQPYKEGSEHIIDQGRNTGFFDEIGFGNSDLKLDAQALANNVRDVQIRMGLNPISSLQGTMDNPMFTIEMETGTGKTYTYIKTMYELNKHYGWSKFVIVVPSVAIREGVYKSFETMQEHFVQEYEKRMQYFIYKSGELDKIESFASDNGMHVMIINMQAFNRSFDAESKKNDSLIIFSERDNFNSRRPIDVLAKTKPIMIIDEPQTVLGTDKKNTTRKNLKTFHPLFTLLYSATHRKEDIFNMVYRLDAIDAYNKRLVKKIEVKGISQVGTTATNSFVYLDKIVIDKGNPQARISFDVRTATGHKQTTRLVGEKFNLFEQSDGLEEYRDNFVVETIDGEVGYVRLLNGIMLYEGDAVGQVNEELLRRIQIRETIRTHIEREKALFGRGIKVLSLFFIDE